MNHRILSYNLYSPRPNDARRDRVLSVIREISPDVMGLQEITPVWKEILEKEFGRRYAFVGDAREEGRDCEYAPVLYNRRKYDCTEWKTYWLSDTPEQPSKLENSKYYRICTVAKLKRKADGKSLLFASVHMDYVWDAAAEQAKILLNVLDRYEKMPTVVCGDFNCNSESPAYATLASSRFRNVAEIAKMTAITPTFTAFGKRYDTIDFVFADQIEAKSYLVPEVKVMGEYPSDHNPLICEFSI